MSSSTFNTTTGEERRTPLTKLSRKYHRRLKRSSAGKVPQQFSPPSPGRNTGLDSAVTPRPEHLSRDQPRNRPRPVSQIGILAGLTGHDSSSEGSSVEVMAPSAAPVLDNVGPSTSRVLGFRPDESQMLAGNLLPAPPPPGISLTSSSSVLGAGGTCGAPLDCAGWKRHESSHVEHAPYLLELTEEEEPIRQIPNSDPSQTSEDEDALAPEFRTLPESPSDTTFFTAQTHVSRVPEKPPRKSLLNAAVSSTSSLRSPARKPSIPAHLLFSVEKRRRSLYVDRSVKGSQVLVEDSDEDDQVPPLPLEVRGPKPSGRRRSFLGRNEVLLLPSDSDTSTEEEQALHSPDVRNHLSKGRRKGLRKWIATSPFSSPGSGQKKTLDDFHELSAQKPKRISFNDTSGDLSGNGSFSVRSRVPLKTGDKSRQNVSLQVSLSSDSSLEGTHPVSNGTSKANLDLTHESSVATSKGYPLLPTHDISTHEPSSCGIDTQNSTEHLSEGTSKAFNVSQNLSSNVTCDLTPHEHTRKSLSLQVSLTSDESVHEIPSDTRDLTNREFVDNHANVLEGLEGKIRDLSIQPGRESSLLKSLEQKREECQTTKRRDNRSLQVSLEDSDDTPNTRKTLENEDLAEDPENSWVDDNDLVRFNEEKVQSKLVRKDEPSSSDDDAFENYLLQMKQKRKEEEKAIQEDSEDDLDKFIVDDFDVEEDGSEDESKEEEEEEDDPDSNYEEEFSEEEEEEDEESTTPTPHRRKNTRSCAPQKKSSFLDMSAEEEEENDVIYSSKDSNEEYEAGDESTEEEDESEEERSKNDEDSHSLRLHLTESEPNLGLHRSGSSNARKNSESSSPDLRNNPGFGNMSLEANYLFDNSFSDFGRDKENDLGSAKRFSPRKPPQKPERKSHKKKVIVVNSSESDQENELPDIPELTPVAKQNVGGLPRPRFTNNINNRNPLTPKHMNNTNTKSVRKKKEDLILQKKSTASFLESLSFEFEDENPHYRVHPDAAKYISRFPKHRVELAERLFKLFNDDIFSNALDPQMPLEWCPRLTKTAGTCTQSGKYNTKTEVFSDRKCRIKLSEKVLDSADRLRDTLIHEMCHAAAWVISGYRAGHGPIWKHWAHISRKSFPELPTISRCHTYPIRTKYTYKCTGCGQQVNRHSKSLDTARKVCGRCKGQFELIVNRRGGVTSQTPGRRLEATTPRKPNAFALFVKENYGAVKTPVLQHKDVMKVLSQKFKETKISAE